MKEKVTTKTLLHPAKPGIQFKVQVPCVGACKFNQRTSQWTYVNCRSLEMFSD